ncbi:Hypothetical protein mma_2193 [Janthinobacterium sp. Marseille]|nr:hypothetical protein [Janthinobacterium sp. Marseille]ABR91677.1 Hypothetical protein mma_2193 [Janthinobacterium sp. Marseille]
MAKFEITAPDGSKHEVTAPDNASEQEIMSYVQGQFSNQAKVDPSVGGSTLQFGPFDTGIPIGESLTRGLAGAGKALTDLGRGAGQLVGAVSRKDVEESRKLDAPLMATTAGKVGNVVGNVAALAPSAFIPGANSVAGAGTIGALTGLLQPSVSTGETLTNVGAGGVAGAGGQVIANKVASLLTNRLGSSNKAADLANALSKTKKDTLAAGQKAGYVVPPSSVNPSFINRRLESIAGKAAVGQEASVRNQAVTNALANKAVGLADDVPMSEGALAGIRKQAGVPYKEVSALSKIAEQDLEALKNARFDAKTYFNFYNRSGDPAALNTAKEATKLAEMLEQSLQNEASTAGRADLLPALQEARKTIAKTYDVGRAVNVGDGGVSAPVIGRLLDKGRPLTSELETIGRMQQAFPAYMREGASIPTPGVSKSEALSAALLATAGGAAGGPLGMAAGALPLLSGPARSMILSKPYQAMMARVPQEASPATLRLAEALMRNKILQGAAPALSAQGVLSAAPMLQE